MAATPEFDPHGPHRRWLARPRYFGRGLVWSLVVHLGVAVLLVALWEIIPGPPPPPVRITTYRDPPTRQDLGLLPDGSLPPGWTAPATK